MGGLILSEWRWRIVNRGWLERRLSEGTGEEEGETVIGM